MEVKINKEIRNFKESIFFGLSLRQFLCAPLAWFRSQIVYPRRLHFRARNERVVSLRAQKKS